MGKPFISQKFWNGRMANSLNGEFGEDVVEVNKVNSFNYLGVLFV